MELSKQEFQELMERIDKELTDEKVPIHARPIKAMAKLSIELDAPVRFVDPESFTIAPEWPSDSISVKMNNWFEERYGDRLRIRFGPGRIALRIRASIWLFHIPGVYGRARVYCSRETIPASKGPPTSFNVLDTISRLATGLRTALTDSELRDIFDAFLIGYRALYAMDPVSSLELVKAALSDHESCVDQLVSSSPHFGQAKWLSLQTTEKMLKGYLYVSGQDFPKTHNLIHLSELTESFGLNKLQSDLLSQIQCSADVRYQNAGISDEEAIISHYNALKISEIAAKGIMKCQIEKNPNQ